jgi:predicted DNA-binding transcriptional regulator AlpA
MSRDAIPTEDTESHERALTTREVGKILGVSEITLSQWRARGKGPRFFRASRLVRYRLADVVAWRNARTVGRREP